MTASNPTRDDQEPTFTDREMRLIYNCINYGAFDPVDGIPGHELMIIISKMAEMLGID